MRVQFPILQVIINAKQTQKTFFQSGFKTEEREREREELLIELVNCESHRYGRGENFQSFNNLRELKELVERERQSWAERERQSWIAKTLEPQESAERRDIVGWEERSFRDLSVRGSYSKKIAELLEKDNNRKVFLPYYKSCVDNPLQFGFLDYCVKEVGKYMDRTACDEHKVGFSNIEHFFNKKLSELRSLQNGTSQAR